MRKEIKLKVAEAIQDDVNKGIVRIDSTYMHQIDCRPGDIVEIEGERLTVGIADRAYPGDIGLNIIRLDGLIRRNAKTSIGDFLVVRKAEVKEAKKVVIAPARKGIMIRANPIIFKQGLLGRAVMKGDVVSLGGTRRRRNTMSGSPFFNEVFNMLDENLIGFGLGDLKFVVADAGPKGAVIITENTVVDFNPEAAELKEEKLPEVTYEDIGGLDEEVKKVREMVELPLKHPEIFERMGIEPPKGVLLQGPPGTGKTLLAKAVASETNSNFILINGPEIMCVTGDTRIFTQQGYVEAKDIFEKAQGELVRNDAIQVIALDKPVETFGFKDGKVVASSITHTAKLRAPTYKVELSDGNSIRCSHNQPFLTCENGELVWKRLEHFAVGDYVARAKQLALPQESQPLVLEGFAEREQKKAPKGRNLSRSNWIRVPEKTSPELLEWVGFVLAEGCVEDDNITFANTDPILRQRYKQLLKQVFDIEKSTEYEDGRVVVYSKVLVAVAGLFGMQPGKKQPAVHPLLFKLPQEEVASFVRGYLDGDGTVALTGKYCTPKLYSKSRAFLHELQPLLLWKLGIPTKLKEHPTPKGLMHALIARGTEGRIKFKQHITPSSTEKAKRLQQTATIHREWAHIPKPTQLLSTLRTNVPYAQYRNNDIYVYGKSEFTKHAFSKLYDIVTASGALSTIVQQEHDILLREDIAWERIESITDEGVQELYDFTADNDSFIAAPYLLLHNSKYYGQSEENLRKKFEEAEKNAPSIIFIDEIDAIASKREESKGEVERRVVAQLLAIMDGLKSRGKVVVIAATNIPNSLDPALRRPGRFDRELEIGVPSRTGRLNILKIHTRGMPLDKTVDLEAIAEVTYGFVGADLSSLAKEAAMIVIRKILPDIKMGQTDEPIPQEVLEKLVISQYDLKEALKVVRPSALREVMVEVPNVKWDHIGGLLTVKQELKETVEWPLNNKAAFARLGIKPPKGVLLYGPPGTGKTMLAKAVATESQANFIVVKGPELLSKWVGESEKAVRKIFEKARQTAPTVIFFDEVDSIAPKRGVSNDSGVTERVVNQLLTEMDGLVELNDVVIIAATNRPDIMDTALLRPGRFDRIIMVGAPDTESRVQIFKIHTKNMPLAKDVDFTELVSKSEGYVGADIEAVAREAAILSLRDDINVAEITHEYFLKALEKVRPSVTKEIQEAYEELETTFRKARAQELRDNKPSYYG